MARVEVVRIILSRKGFDSGSGGCPSPIFPDGRMLSLPIPDKASETSYDDIRWQGTTLGRLVSALTHGRVKPGWKAHLDPDLRPDSLERPIGWRPLFGQEAASLGHLMKCGISEGDLFLFFGLFREVEGVGDSRRWKAGSRPRHVLWGWLQVGETLDHTTWTEPRHQWTAYHPHRQPRGNSRNALFVSSEILRIGGHNPTDAPGAGVFPTLKEDLVLTLPGQPLVSRWRMPEWMLPRDGVAPLSYHGDASRWSREEGYCVLDTVGRGQEFVLDASKYPEAEAWAASLIAMGRD